jgi:triosephosphate isomerase (TIM)
MKKIFAANWKMFKNRQQCAETASELLALVREHDHNAAHQGHECHDAQCSCHQNVQREVIVFPQFMGMHAVAMVFGGADDFSVGAQNMYPAAEGAFTGEISPAMLHDARATWVLVGHSERRHLLGEQDDFVAKKTAFALEQGFKVMLCIGETLAEREAGQLEQVLTRQLDTALKNVPATCDEKTIALAYEPVWAIGTGRVATLEEIKEVHALVRKLLVQRFPNFGAETPILYGGSVKPDNAGAIILLDNVDGLLVGGASLVAESFSRIIFA